MPTFDPDSYFSTHYDNITATARNYRDNTPSYFREDPLSSKIRELAAARERKQEGLALLQKQGGNFIPSYGVGAGRTVEAFGAAYGLLPGRDMDNALRRLGADTAEYWQDRKSGLLIGEELDRAQAVQDADGLWDEFSTAFSHTVSSPALLGSLLTEQIPTLAVSGGLGRGVSTGTRLLGAGKATQAASGLTGAIAANTVQHGGEVGGETYDRIMELPESLLEESEEYVDLRNQVGPEQAREQLARRGARTAATRAGAVTAVTTAGLNVIPGGRTIEQALVRNSVTGSRGGKLVSGAVGEGVQEVTEEGSGQFFSNLAVSGLDPEQDLLEGVGEGSALGLLGGGILGGITSAISPNERKQLLAQEEQQITRVQNIAATEAIETGDVSSLLDPSSEAYHPPKAAAALIARIRNPQISEEERTEARENLTELQSVLRDTITQQEEIIKSYDDSYIASLGRERGQARSVLMLAEEGLATEEEVQEAQATIDRVTATLDSLRSRPAKKKTAERQLSAMKAHQDTVNTLVSDLNRMTNRDGEIETKLGTIRETKDPNVREKESNLVIELHMEDPNSIPPERARQLAEDDSSGFTEEQRNYLRTASEAHESRLNAVNVGTVANNIFVGRAGFKGVMEYHKSVAEGIRTGNRSMVEAELADLRRFSASHGEKARLAREGIQEAIKNNAPMYLVRDTREGGTWRLTDKMPSAWRSEGRKARQGGLTLTAASANLASQIAIEAESLESTLQNLEIFASLQTPSAAPTPSSTATEGDTTTDAPAPTTEATAPSQETPVGNELDSLLALSDDEAIARLNPDNVRASDDDVITLSSGDMDVPMDSKVIGSFTDSTGATVGLYEAGNGGLYAVKANAVLGRIEPGTEENETVLDVVQEAQGRGIGLHLATEYIRRNPTAQAGSFTEGGEAVYRAALRRLRQERAEDGGLSLLEGNQERVNGPLTNAQLPTVNKIKAYFTQESSKPDARTKRPLVAVKDFLSKWILNSDLALSYLDSPEDVTTGQQELLQSLQSYAEAWSPRIRENIEKSFVNRRFYYEDYAQYFKEGQLDENLTTAIAVGAYTWVIEEVGGYGLNTEADIRRILRLEESDPIPQAALEALTTAGIRDQLVKQSIGKHVAEALGLRAHPQAPINEQAQLELALGVHGLAILEQNGWVETHYVAGSIMNTPTDSTHLKNGDMIFSVPLNNPNNKVRVTASPRPKEGRSVTNADMSNLRVLGKLDFDYVIQDSSGNTIPTPNDADTLKYLRQQAERAFKEIHTPHPFVRIKRNWNGKDNPPLSAEVQRIDELSRGFGSTIHKLFGTEPNKTAPEFSPIAYAQTKVRGTSMGVPGVLERIRNKLTQRPHILRPDMLSLKKAFDEDILMHMEGYIPIGDIYVRKGRIKNVEARNADILRSYSNLNDFEQLVVRKETNRPFFFDYLMQRQQRMGMNSSAVNPHSNKIHRRYVAMQEWETSFTVGDNSAEETFFKLSVAQGLGIKTDKQFNFMSLSQLEQLQADPLVEESIGYLQAIPSLNEGEVLTPRAQYVISTVVGRTKNGTHALDALYSLAQYLAVPEGETFTSYLSYEVDGVTNGAALSHLSLGLLTPEIGEKFGFFTQDSESDFYADWRTKEDSTDFYETLGGEFSKALESISSTPHEGEKVKALSTIVGPDFTGREAVKTPTLAVVFGSSMKGVIEGMTEEFFTRIDSNMESAANAGNTEQLAAIIDAINTVLSKHKAPRVPSFKTIESAMEWEFSPVQIKALSDAFSTTYGAAMTEAVNSNFSSFMRTRDAINNAVNSSWALYNIAFDHLVEERKKQLGKEGGIATDNRGRVIQELSSEDISAIREQLKELEPVVRTPMSKVSGELDSGIWFSKEIGRMATERDAAYTQKVAVGNPLPNRKANARVNGRGRVVEAEAPGVAPMIMLTHSLESAITSGVYDQFNTLHIHDAEAFKLADTIEGARLLNQNTYRMSSNYSVSIEVYNTFTRVLNAFTALEQEIPVLTKLRNEYATANKVNFNAQQSELGVLSLQRELDKQTYLSSLKTVDQFALEGGQYVVTDNDRAVTAKRAERVKAQLDALLKDNRERVSNLLTEESRDTETVKERLPEAPQGRKYPTDTPWGRVGEPLVPSNEGLVDFFESNPNPTPKALLQETAKQIKASSDLRPGTKRMQLALARQLYSLVSDDMEISYITPDSPVTPQRNIKTARGWYRMDSKGERIGIKSPDFIYSSVTPETVLHELTHAVTAQIIEQEQRRKAKNPEYTSPALDAINELERLRVLAEEHPDTPRPAVKDVHELVAWGMTNRDFQKVLYGLRIESTAPSNPLINGMKSFINSLISIIFPGRSPDTKANFESGLGALIANTSILMAAQQESTEGTYAVTLKQEADPTTYTTQEVFEALGRTDTATELNPQHAERLTELLTSVVDNVYGADESLKSRYEREAPAETLDAFINSISSGSIPFTTPSINYIRLSDQEAFVLEQMELAATTALNSNESQPIRAELSRLYHEAKKAISPNSLPAGVYDYIFNVKLDSNNRSNHLARFLSVSLVYQPMYEAMESVDSNVQVESTVGQPLGRRISILFNRLMAIIRGWQTGVRATMQGAERLEVLGRSMAQIEMKRKLRLAKEQRDSAFGYIETKFKRASDTLRGAVTKATNAPLIRDSKIKSIRGIGAITRTAAGNNAESLVDMMMRTRDRMIKSKHGTLASVINEIRGGANNSQTFHSLLWEMSEHQRQRRLQKELSISLTKAAFKNDLTKEQSESLTRVFVKSGLTDIREHYTIEDMDSFLTSPDALEAAITEWESRVPESEYRDYYLNASETLGIYLATGEVADVLMLNAHNIAFLGGFTASEINAVNVQQANQVKSILDVLISLYALRHQDDSIKNTASGVVREELSRDDGNGIDFLLKSHAHMQEVAFTDLFNSEETSFAKGYTKEIFNPYITTEVATEAKGAELVKAGYSKGPKVGKDPADPDYKVDHYIYTIRDGGLNTWVSGVMGTVSRKAAGTTIYDMTTQIAQEVYGDFHEKFGENANNLIGREIGKRRASFENAQLSRIRQMKQGRKDYSNKGRATSYAVPVIGTDGRATDYRYLMNEHTKEVILQRDNRLEYVFGEMVSHAFDKAGAPEINKAAVEALREDFDTHYAERPESFIHMSALSEDADIVERYLNLPADTRKHIQEVWGEEGMWVRKDVLDMVFGYRKKSVVNDIFESDPMQRGLAAHMFVSATEAVMGKKAALYLRRAGDFWQALVRIIKDNRVIRSLFVLTMNNMSNATQLYLKGVPLRKIITGMVAGHRDAITYNKNQRELWKLEQLRDMGYIPPGESLNEIEQRIAELTDEIKRNPFNKIADAGLQQTIVQDIEPDEDIYTYRAQWARKFKESTEWLPDIVKNTGKFVFMAHNTPVYEFMKSAAQLGDFVSRQILFEHLTTKKDSPLSTEEALSVAMEAFVNYDLPTHKNIQYLNDMGLLWFTKYYFRIQKVLFSMLRDNPARAIGLLAAVNVIPGMSTILDASFWARGRWVGTGALEYFDSFGSISTLRAMKSIAHPFG